MLPKCGTGFCGRRFSTFSTKSTKKTTRVSQKTKGSNLVVFTIYFPKSDMLQSNSRNSGAALSPAEMGRMYVMMGRVSINQGTGNEAMTPVSNSFIESYMPAANDVQIKVYLYLLYAMHTGISTDEVDLADRFNYPVQDIRRAINYWVGTGLMDARFDQNGNLSGLHVENLIPETRVSSVTVLPARSQTIPFSGQAAASEPFHDPADPKRLEILNVIEYLMDRPLSPTDVSVIDFIRDELKFSDDLIRYLVEYCIERGKRRFSYIKAVALGWSNDGITTVEEAKQQSARYDKNYYTIMNYLGMGNNNLTDIEASYFTRWLEEYAMPLEVIREACEMTVVKTQSNRLNYCDRILTRWHEAGITSITQARVESTSFRTEQKKKKERAAANNTFNQYKNFKQRDYDYEALKEQLLKK